MKNYMIKLIALLMFSSVAISSCSLQYREHRKAERHDRGHNNDDHHDDHHYNRY